MKKWIERYPQLQALERDMVRAAQMLVDSYRAGGTVLLAGNGGSCSDCSHICGELMKGFLSKRPLNKTDKEAFSKLFGESGAEVAAQLQYGMPAIALPAQDGVLTAFCNDVNPALMYAQLVYGYGKKNDVFWGISTSGNAENVRYAAMAAKAKGMRLIGLTGKNACAMDGVYDLVLHVPETETYKIQELHLPVYHAICAWVEAECFEKREG